MSEIERVANMVADGRITPEEGDRLIAVLRSVGPSDTPGTSMPPLAPAAPAAPTAPVAPVAPVPPATPAGPAAQATPTSQAAPAASVAPVTPAAATSQTPPGAAAARAVPPTVRWVRVEMVAGDLDVTVDPQLIAPTGTSDTHELRFEPTDEGYRLTGAPRRGAGPVRLGLGNVMKGDFSLRLPPGFGVDLAKTAGDIDLGGVEFLRGTLTGGDLGAHGLKGVDLDTVAGNVDISIAPTSGRHRIAAKAGVVNVVLLPGSDVTVDGGVSVGDIKTEPPFRTERRLVGCRVEGTVGAGTATLELKVIAGDIFLRSGDDHE